MKYWIRTYRKWIYQQSKRKFEVVFWGSGVLLLFVIFDIETLKGIELGNIANIARTIENIAPKFLKFFTYSIVQYAIGGAFIITSSFYLSKIYLRPKARVIKHCSFSHTQSAYDKTNLQGYLVKEIDVDLTDLMAENNIKTAIRTQDEAINELLKKCDEYTEICYYGIAHIPLIFRAGFQVGDEGQSRLFHKFRDAGPLFKDVSTGQDNYAIRLKHYVKDRRNISSSNEMLVVIATSLEVKPMDLFSFQQKDLCCELYFKPDDNSQYGFDNIASYPTMRRLKNGILSEIRKQSAEYNVQQIHLILSTSSDFTFYLAEGFSRHHDPEIIVYQYERNSDVKYPWGISNKAAPGAAVFYTLPTTVETDC